jgi:hypothetical protein
VGGYYCLCVLVWDRLAAVLFVESQDVSAEEVQWMAIVGQDRQSVASSAIVIYFASGQINFCAEATEASTITVTGRWVSATVEGNVLEPATCYQIDCQFATSLSR